jgi:hypothetical protein
MTPYTRNKRPKPIIGNFKPNFKNGRQTKSSNRIPVLALMYVFPGGGSGRELCKLIQDDAGNDLSTWVKPWLTK